MSAASASAPARRPASLAGRGAAVSRPKKVKTKPSSICTSPELAELWHNVLLTQGAVTLASHAYEAAQAKLPWWAAPGPRLIDSDGNHCGPVSNHPAIQDLGRARFGWSILRPEPSDFESEFDHHRVSNGEGAAHAYLDKQMADFDARTTARRAEYIKLRLDDLFEACDDAVGVSCEAKNAVLALPDTLDVLAARIVFETIAECLVTETAETSAGVAVAIVALNGLLPHLSGELAEDVAEIVGNPRRELRHMRVLAGIDATGARVPL